ncbi:MAG TPA: hypothetical protein VED20_02035 [Streptosporangiaceae bacterium]|nr:hypothetical protein [Streptosporangiaceae bacterium]
MWRTAGHRRAKTITNCVVNRWGDGPDTPAAVRARLARQNDPSLEHLLARVDDEMIAIAISGVWDLEQRWMAVPPGGTLRLSWPLPPGASSPGRRAGLTDDQGQRETERPVRVQQTGPCRWPRCRA